MAVVLIAVVSALMPGVARADGDPASDVLATQSAYMPLGTTARQQARLEGVLRAAAHAGYPIRVAVIASPADLGSITGLWRHPQDYAEFLGQELSLAATGRVLVVMPEGFGLYQPGVAASGDARQLARTPPPPRSGGLAEVASAAVKNLAAASGHPIPASAIATATPAVPKAGGSGSVIPRLVFAAGAVVMAAAWTLSLRARPLRLREQRP